MTQLSVILQKLLACQDFTMHCNRQIASQLNLLGVHLVIIVTLCLVVWGGVRRVQRGLFGLYSSVRRVVMNAGLY